MTTARMSLYAVWTSMIDPRLIEAASFGGARAQVGDPKAAVPIGLYVGSGLSPEVTLVENPFAVYDRGRVGMRFEERFYPFGRRLGSMKIEAVRYREGTHVHRLGPALVECPHGCGGWAHDVERCDLCMGSGPCSRDLIDAPARVVDDVDGEDEVRHDLVCAACALKIAIGLEAQAAALSRLCCAAVNAFEKTLACCDLAVTLGVGKNDESNRLKTIGAEIANKMQPVSEAVDELEKTLVMLVTRREGSTPDLVELLQDARTGLAHVLEIAKRLRGGR